MTFGEYADALISSGISVEGYNKLIDSWFSYEYQTHGNGD